MLEQKLEQCMYPMNIKEILLSNRRIHETTGCWLWTGRLQTDGYGVISLPNESNTRRRDYLVHRLSYIEFKGQPNKFVLHIVECFFKHCFNPEHLYDGNHKNNAEDLMVFGQHSNQYGKFDKTHCYNNHPLEGNNLVIWGGRRTCRICAKERKRKYRNKNE